MLSGLTCDKARPNGDGAGDHARASSAFLTGCQARKTAGANFRAGVSADQAAAARLGEQTRLPSLELAVEKYRGVGNCDSGYSCAYSSTVSWRTETTPVPKEINPALVFDRPRRDATGATIRTHLSLEMPVRYPCLPERPNGWRAPHKGLAPAHLLARHCRTLAQAEVLGLHPVHPSGSPHRPSAGVAPPLG